jgi:hypothetical protein
MNKRKFFGLLGSSIVGAFLSIGMKPLKKLETISENKVIQIGINIEDCMPPCNMYVLYSVPDMKILKMEHF